MSRRPSEDAGDKVALKEDEILPKIVGREGEVAVGKLGLGLFLSLALGNVDEDVLLERDTLQKWLCKRIAILGLGLSHSPVLSSRLYVSSLALPPAYSTVLYRCQTPRPRPHQTYC